MQYNARSKQQKNIFLTKFYLKQDFKFMIKVKAFAPLFPSYKIFSGLFLLLWKFVDQFPQWSASLIVTKHTYAEHSLTLFMTQKVKKLL